jgi:hypothetical protein
MLILGSQLAYSEPEFYSVVSAVSVVVEGIIWVDNSKQLIIHYSIQIYPTI